MRHRDIRRTGVLCEEATHARQIIIVDRCEHACMRVCGMPAPRGRLTTMLRSAHHSQHADGHGPDRGLGDEVHQRGRLEGGGACTGGAVRHRRAEEAAGGGRHGHRVQNHVDALSQQQHHQLCMNEYMMQCNACSVRAAYRTLIAALELWALCQRLHTHAQAHAHFRACTHGKHAPLRIDVGMYTNIQAIP